MYFLRLTSGTNSRELGLLFASFWDIIFGSVEASAAAVTVTGVSPITSSKRNTTEKSYHFLLLLCFFAHVGVNSLSYWLGT